jgi:hypothetical protein
MNKNAIIEGNGYKLNGTIHDIFQLCFCEFKKKRGENARIDTYQKSFRKYVKYDPVTQIYFVGSKNPDHLVNVTFPNKSHNTVSVPQITTSHAPPTMYTQSDFEIAFLRPSNGSTEGHTKVDIWGSNFDPTFKFKFGNAVAEIFRFIDKSHIICYAPPNPDNPCRVEVFIMAYEMQISSSPWPVYYTYNKRTRSNYDGDKPSNDENGNNNDENGNNKNEDGNNKKKPRNANNLNGKYTNTPSQSYSPFPHYDYESVFNISIERRFVKNTVIQEEDINPINTYLLISNLFYNPRTHRDLNYSIRYFIEKDPYFKNCSDKLKDTPYKKDKNLSYLIHSTHSTHSTHLFNSVGGGCHNPLE